MSAFGGKADIQQVSRTFHRVRRWNCSASLAAVNVEDDVASIVSVKPFIEAMPIEDVRIVEIPSEKGV
jgi:hypothetical protein